MPKESKIGSIRDELSRIASRDDRQDIFSPTMMASWSYTRVLVIGKTKMDAFDFDVLSEILKRIPSGAGEVYFWNTVGSTDQSVFGEKLDRECQVIQLREWQRRA